MKSLKKHGNGQYFMNVKDSSDRLVLLWNIHDIGYMNTHAFRKGICQPGGGSGYWILAAGTVGAMLRLKQDPKDWFSWKGNPNPVLPWPEGANKKEYE
ncbi:MAG: hypothetical protein NTY68_01725 [Candidatus Micrarchaeota archaeon]|nr:hypothetical protein [Candidatus Micrarchaeota archaeon]